MKKVEDFLVSSAFFDEDGEAGLQKGANQPSDARLQPESYC